ncbi:hypothetical protein V8C35DRAFT_79807 [Trichoderma chlorosporum]
MAWHGMDRDIRWASNAISYLAAKRRMPRSKWLVACRESVAPRRFNLETTQVKQTADHHAHPSHYKSGTRDTILSAATADLHVRKASTGKLILASSCLDGPWPHGIRGPFRSQRRHGKQAREMMIPHVEFPKTNATNRVLVEFGQRTSRCWSRSMLDWE